VALALVAGGFLLAGCAVRRAHPVLSFRSLMPDREDPQLAGSLVRWEASVSGGVGMLLYEFHVRGAAGETVEQTGPSSSWIWTPRDAGPHRVKVVVRDTLGYAADSGWSETYEILPELTVSLSADRPSPVMASVSDVWWNADAAGGAGQHTLEFWLDEGEGAEPLEATSGDETSWRWSPHAVGAYRVQAVVRDVQGNTASSGWSAIYEVTPALGADSTLAVLPLENLSGAPAPVREIHVTLLHALRTRGVPILADDELQEFMARHRMRNVGGLSTDLGRACREETGAAAVLVTSVDLFSEGEPPKLALTSRLVSTGEKPAILWMETAVATGNQSPGAFGLGLVRDPYELERRVVDQIADALAGRVLEGEARPSPGPARKSGPEGKTTRRFKPKSYYRSPHLSFGADEYLRVAVLPFENDTSRTSAGEIIRLQFVRHLLGTRHVEVVEPGVVRQALLESRLIMLEGLSLPQADLLRVLLDVDVVISGTVSDYQEARGLGENPFVGMMVYGIDTHQGQVVWSSTSHNRGNDRVFFFDSGRLYTALAVCSRMVDQVVKRILAPAESGASDPEASRFVQGAP